MGDPFDNFHPDDPLDVFHETHTPVSKRKRCTSFDSPIDTSPQQLQEQSSSFKRTRHAQQQEASPIRASKFYEGNMMDSMRGIKDSWRIPAGSLQSYDCETLPNTDQCRNPRTERSSKTPAVLPRAESTVPSLAQSLSTLRSKPSSVFRSGRRWANSLNPVQVWKSVTKTWMGTKDDPTLNTLQADWASITSGALSANVSATTGLHQPSVTNGCDLDPFTPADSRYNYSVPTSDLSNAQSSRDSKLRSSKSMFHLKRSSKSSLKRVASGLGLNLRGPTSKIPQPATQAQENSTHHSSQLRQSRSRHDLDTLEKLAKRVSHQELKLEKARRDLIDFTEKVSPLQEIVPHYERYTPRFALARPGMDVFAKPLASFPSESLLQFDVEGAADTASDQHELIRESAPACAVEERPRDTGVCNDVGTDVVADVIAPVEQHQDVTEASSTKASDVPTKPTSKTAAKKSKKRKSGNERDKAFRPGATDSDSEGDNDIKQLPRPKRTRRAPTKLRKADSTQPEMEPGDNGVKPTTEVLDPIPEHCPLDIGARSYVSIAEKDKCDSPMEHFPEVKPAEQIVSAAMVISDSNTRPGLSEGDTDFGLTDRTKPTPQTTIVQTEAVVCERLEPDFDWPEDCF